ncbi:MAG: nucleotide sugar dehydrogenase [Kiritimatiellae bacterium]|nr:nucleotide sugar dehydrogenase [Kiritimatiellia bacterium]
MAKSEVIGLVGLGYVGMPLAMAFAEQYRVIGFDASQRRISELKAGKDSTGEFSAEELRAADRLELTVDPAALMDCTFIIVAVPTPLGDFKEPDLTALRGASVAVGKILKPGMAVVYESTVYPGVTEEECLPLLERESGLKLGDFDLGYSPERVNPGDREHTVAHIKKIVSGHSAASLERVRRVYGSVIVAGVHAAPTIKTAEAAKVIENVQRDLNIALMNELAKIFSLMGIDTHEVLEAAGTKWNFHRYHPGLVGGHCIGVDPYYLTHRALQLGYHPEVILAGRRINDSMSHYVGEQTICAMVRSKRLPQESRVLVMGLTFKENVPDIRNSKAVDVVHFLARYGADVTVWEPMLSPDEIRERFGFKTGTLDDVSELDAVC